MRITTLVSRDRRIADLLRGQERLEAAQDQVSTGHRIQKPSDSPNEIAELLRVRAYSAELTRRQNGIKTALPAMKASEAALGDITAALRDARTMTLQAKNDTTSAEQRRILADQVGLIADRVRDLANTRVNGRYVFAGTRTDTEPFPDGAPGVYTGNDAAVPVSLTEGIEFQTNVTGQSLMNTRGSTDLFSSLASLEAAIRAGDSAGMSTGLGALDTHMNNVIRLRGDMGSRLQYVDLAQGRLTDDLLVAQERRSQLEDADLGESLINEKSAEYAQEATLAMAAQLGRLSLLDYMR